MIDLPSACLGTMFIEPYCPCAMKRLNLPPSPERLADRAFRNTPEEVERQAALWKEFRDMFNRNRKLSEHI